MIFEFLSAGLPQILHNAGSSFVFYDMEHSGFSMEQMKFQLALCRGLDIVPLVRPPDTSYQYTATLLDIGAMGMLFQMCETAEQAEEFVKWTRYPPSGQRGAMFGGAHDDYSSDSVPDIIAGAHERTMVCVLIESAKGKLTLKRSCRSLEWMLHTSAMAICLCPSKSQETQRIRLCKKESTPFWKLVKLTEKLQPALQVQWRLGLTG